MLALLMDVNQAWAQHAGALIAVVSRNTYQGNDAPALTHSFDTGAAWMSLVCRRSLWAGQPRHVGIEHDAIPEPESARRHADSSHSGCGRAGE